MLIPIGALLVPADRGRVKPSTARPAPWVAIPAAFGLTICLSGIWTGDFGSHQYDRFGFTYENSYWNLPLSTQRWES